MLLSFLLLLSSEVFLWSKPVVGFNLNWILPDSAGDMEVQTIAGQRFNTQEKVLCISVLSSRMFG